VGRFAGDAGLDHVLATWTRSISIPSPSNGDRRSSSSAPVPEFST